MWVRIEADVEMYSGAQALAYKRIIDVVAKALRKELDNDGLDAVGEVKVVQTTHSNGPLRTRE